MVRLFYRLIYVFLFMTTGVNVMCAQEYCDLMYDANWIWRASDTMERKPTTVQITFTEDSFVADTMWRPMEIGSQNCSISRKEGELLFYSNGCYVANAMDEGVPNGDSLNPGYIFNSQCKGTAGSYIGSQGMFALPAPYSDSLFYLFHKQYEDVYGPSFHVVVENVYSSILNVKRHGGRGEMIAKNIPIIADTNVVSSNFSAVKHADGTSWWIVTHTAYGNGFYIMLFDSSGVSEPITQNIGGVTSPRNDAGQLKFSPDGAKMAMYHSKSGVYLFDFDRSTGMLSNDMAFGPVDSTSIIGGCEFSPSGRFLYVNTMRDIYQYDIRADDIPGSEVHIGHYDGFLSPFATLFYHMERTPHGRIFMNCPNQVNVLHVIESPNLKGLDCDFRQHGIVLPGNIFWSMPHYPNYRLGALEDPPCDTYVSVDKVDTNDQKLSVFPNPCMEEVAILSPMEWSKVELYDLSGRRLKTSDQTGFISSINVGDLANGMYVLVATSAGGRRVAERVVVSH